MILKIILIIVVIVIILFSQYMDIRLIMDEIKSRKLSNNESDEKTYIKITTVDGTQIKGRVERWDVTGTHITEMEIDVN